MRRRNRFFIIYDTRTFRDRTFIHGSIFLCVSGTSTVISNYRNKVSVSDYTAGGVLAGAVYKFSLGPKGMVAGGFFGGFLGTLSGVMWSVMLKLSGIKMPEVYSETHKYFRWKDEQFHQSFKVSRNNVKCGTTDYGSNLFCFLRLF